MSLELLEVVGEGVEDGLVVFLPGLLRVDGGDAGGDQRLVIGELLLPVRHVLRLEGVFQLLVKHQPVEDLDDGLLVGASLRPTRFSGRARFPC